MEKIRDRANLPKSSTAASQRPEVSGTSISAKAEELKAPFQSHKFFHKREARNAVLVSLPHLYEISAGKVIF